jgi:molecular chaperone GrpE
MPGGDYTARDVTEDPKTTEVENAESGPAPGENANSDAEVIVEELSPLEEARAEAALMKDKLMRTAADFDNYRKRTRREVSDAEIKARSSLLSDLLPVFDNLERATAHAGVGSSEDSDASIKGLVDGISLVVKQFRDALGRIGIERVASVGQPFDPGVHEAIQHLETTDFAAGTIAAEVQAGYR